MAGYLKDEKAECINDSIVDQNDTVKLQEIIRKAELLLGNIGLRVEPSRITFKIVDQKKMNSQLQSENQTVVGLTWPISISDKLHIIWLLENRSYIFLLSVVAHEMGHTWCRDHHVRFSKMEEEGFCELIAYHVLSTQFSKLGSSWMQRMIQNPDPIYGDGLRHMKKQFEICGRSWFKFLGFIRLGRV